jgi:hypothetical protein
VFLGRKGHRLGQIRARDLQDDARDLVLLIGRQTARCFKCFSRSLVMRAT